MDNDRYRYFSVSILNYLAGVVSGTLHPLATKSNSLTDLGIDEQINKVIKKSGQGMKL